MKKHTAVILNALAWLIVCGGAIIAVVMAAREPAMSSQLRAWRDGQLDRFTGPWQSIDQVIGKTSPGGNIGLVFSGFDPNSLYAINAVQIASYRTAYVSYPRRALNTWDGTIVKGGKTILENRFDPDIPWLQAHNVRTVILFTAAPDDSFNVNFADIPEPANSDSAGTRSQGVR